MSLCSELTPAASLLPGEKVKVELLGNVLIDAAAVIINTAG